MYSIVLRHLDGQNKGVQTTHGVCEYVRKHWDDEDLQQWINQDKTLVMLSGGTVSDMNEIRACFDEVGIPYETFEEEDLASLHQSVYLQMRRCGIERTILRSTSLQKLTQRLPVLPTQTTLLSCMKNSLVVIRMPSRKKYLTI